MKRVLSREVECSARLCCLAALVLVTTTVPLALAAERIVLCEEFTNTGCTYCPYAGQALSIMLNDPNVAPYFSMLQIHLGDAYTTTWGNGRDTFYNVTGTPTAWFDGWTSVVGAGSVQGALTAYMQRFNARRNVATDVEVSLTAVQESGWTYTVRARAAVDPNGAARTMKMHVVRLLDYFPSNPSYSRNCVRQGVTSSIFTVQPGQSYVWTTSVTFDPNSQQNPNNIRLVAFAQDPNSAAPAQVRNARVLFWPFGPDCNANGIPDEEEVDCNENTVPDDCDIANGTSLDLNGNGIPDECEAPPYPVGDMNCSGAVGFEDINPFVQYVTSCETWQAANPGCPSDIGDINQNGQHSCNGFPFDDINAFVALLAGG